MWSGLFRHTRALGVSPEIKWLSLYKGLPEDIYPEDAPLLVRVMFDDLQQWNWLQALAKEMSSTAPLLVLCSSWSFSQLGKWLTEIANARQEGRKEFFGSGILAFFLSFYGYSER
jgi:hypothetical protein